MPNVLMWCLYVKGNFSVEATHAGPKNLTLGTGKKMSLAPRKLSDRLRNMNISKKVCTVELYGEANG